MKSPYAKDFSLPEKQIYFNCAAQGPLPNLAAEAVAQSIRDKQSPATIDMPYTLTRTKKIRQLIGKMFDSPKECVALANSTTWGENILAQSLNWVPGDEVVMMDGQFPSTMLPYHLLKDRGVKVVTYQCANNIFDWDKFLATLTPKTRLVSLEWVHWISGDRIPLDEILSELKKRNILSVVDITQGCGAIPFSWKQFPADVVCASSYKWFLSPYGTGFILINDQIQKLMTSRYANWLTLKSVVEGSLEQSLEFVQTAQRFDCSSNMGFMNLDGMTASAAYLDQCGVDNIFAHNQKIVDSLYSFFEGRSDATLFAPLQKNRRSNIVSLKMPKDTSAELISKKLAERDMHACSRLGNTLRLSPHLYNDVEQAKQFCATLVDLLGH